MAISNAGSSTRITAAPGGNSYKSAFAMVTTLFFVWGFLTSLNDILIPHLKAIFDLNYAGALLIQFAFFSAYAAFGLISGKIVEWIGYQRTMVAGLLTMGVGAILFVPAANMPSFPLFLTALIVLAAGITALQVAANPYVTVLGSPQTASSRLNLTQAFNSLGTTIGPPLGGWLILKGAEKTVENTDTMSKAALHAYRIQQAATVKFPYLAITLALVVLALAIAFYKFPRLDTTKDYRPTKAADKGASMWRYPHVVLGAVAIFVYVGAEVSIGSFLINYFNQSYILGLTALAAANLVPFYWGGAMVGRFLGSAVLQKVKTGHLLTFCAIVAGLLVLISMMTSGHAAAWSILAVGFFNSIMFPSIFTLGVAEMGPLTGEASGLLVTAIVGGAIIPEIQGVLADKIGIHHAFIVPVICYVFIAYYGWRGSRIIQPS
ncbi:FHS family L-fucose permease-like MFS transporter [Silvibacterium bohemicum]|uniref:FHS family L-fucose permease-like MFS transporter n=1 Tax=Silvibacterium bohemicum TaxID=1577686 RepID=A0A841JZD4_9BACT|nr:sugar MFS transporter [Silvibacterium bohemicum]MBB6146005.1 FHS family L-fucose permease-like MFS transporter [Silvibacterium bohemicum]